MGYIEDLRKYVGHRPIVMVGAGVLVVDAQGRLLMGKRTDNHAWGIPGGSLEPGETLEDTARRETCEETGLEIGAMDLFGVFSGPQLYYVYPNGDEVYNVSAVFETRDFQGELCVQEEEHTSFIFFAADELPEPIGEPLMPIIAEWLRRRKINRAAQ
jgi:8-oxo-dGTP pyrophosphatase MutT (NUDIX family)